MSDTQQPGATSAETRLAQPQPVQAISVPLADGDKWVRGPLSSNGGHHVSDAAGHGAESESTLQQRASSLPSISLLSLNQGQASAPRHRPAISPSHSPSSPRRRSSHHIHHERHCSRVNEIKEGDDDNFVPDAVVPEMLPEEAIPFYDQTPPEMMALAPDSPERTSPLPIPGLKKRTSWIAPNPHGIPHSPLGGSNHPHSCSPLTTCLPLTPEARLSPSPPEPDRLSTGPNGCAECPDDVQTFLDSPKGHYHSNDKAHSEIKAQRPSAQVAESSRPAQSLGLQM